MPKYRWEATPHITRPDVFAEGTEVGHRHFDGDKSAIDWLEKTFAKHNNGTQKVSMKIMIGNRVVRVMKTQKNQ